MCLFLQYKEATAQLFHHSFRIMQLFSLTSVLALAFVVGQASAANVVASATEFTVGDSVC